MLSRVANAIYWMNRSVERAENYARFIDVNLNLTLDLPHGTAEQWEPLVTTTGDHALFNQRYGKPTRENVVQFLAADAANPNSVLSCLTAARENARSVREIISSEMWEQVNRFYLMVKEAVTAGWFSQDPYRFFTEVKQASHLLSGITDATMSHGEGWHFGRLGRLLERADKTSRILDVKYFILLPHVSDVDTPFDNIQWSALLKSASALEMYRKQYGRIAPNLVADFLILNPAFPRAIRYCVIKAEDSLRAISGSDGATARTQPEKKVGRLRAELEYTDIDEIRAGGLHEFLDGLQAELNGIDDAIHDTFFALRPVQGAIHKGEVQ